VRITGGSKSPGRQGDCSQAEQLQPHASTQMPIVALSLPNHA
jgi:hypothetical protein